MLQSKPVIPEIISNKIRDQKVTTIVEVTKIFIIGIRNMVM